VEAERGLPVKRLPGRRGMVWADVAELNAWRESAELAKNAHESETRTVSAALVSHNKGENSETRNKIVEPVSRKKFASERGFWWSLVVLTVCLIVVYVARSNRPARLD
jgi:hypothetical protein